MLRQLLKQHISTAVKAYLAQLGVADDASSTWQPSIELPKNPEHGDFAVNVSALARWAKQAPPQIAEGVVQHLPADSGFETQVIAGFINFKIAAGQLAQVATTLLQQPAIGQNNSLQGTCCLLEFVSANPTGPLHIGHGRWVALGDSLARIMTHSGAKVHKEFYVNDAGAQINNLAMSIWLYALIQLKTPGVEFPTPVEGEKFAYYAADYVKVLASDFLKDNTEAVKQWYSSCQSDVFSPPKEALDALKTFGMTVVKAQQAELMAKCRLQFDHWFSEQTLYNTGAVETIVERLKATGKTFEQDGALWLKTTDYGDDQDRVLKKSNGFYTYLTPDVAYHHDKYQRDNQQYNLLINIWGADHHGYIARVKAALTALGHNADQLEIVLGQLVTLKIDGQSTRMGKRKKMVTLEELVEEVGVDPVRFWMVSKSADTALEFDVDLALSQSNDNPVFYAQYAHARCCSILRNAIGVPATVGATHTQAEWQELTQAQLDSYYQSNAGQSILEWFELFATESAEGFAALKQLLIRIEGFEDKVAEAAKHRSPHLIARFALDLAADFHHFYNVCRILTPEVESRLPRLTIVELVKRTMAEALALLGVTAPSSM